MTKARSNAVANAAKGDLTVGSGTNTSAILALGADGDSLVADNVAATGLAYKTKGVFNGLTTTGDTIYSSSGTTQSRLGIGSTGQVLTVASGVPSWATPASGGGMTLISTTTLSGASTTISVGSNSYKNLVMFAESIDCSNDVDVFMQLNGETGATAYTPVVTGSQNGVSYTNFAKTNGVYINQPGSDGFGTGNDNSSNITIYNANSVIRKVIDASVGALVTGSRVVPVRNTATVGSTAVISSIVWKVTSGTFDAGTVKLFGVS